MENVKFRPITSEDDLTIADIVRKNLKEHGLDIPGTVYFDPELDCLSSYYKEQPEKRQYLIAVDCDGNVIGGVGFAEFEYFENCAELQKLYLVNHEKGKGYGKLLMQTIEDYAREVGYHALYLETHTNLEIAINLYERMGFRRISKPENVNHSTMNRFYYKEI